MPEGNQIHRFAERHAAAFQGKRVSVDSPNGGFSDAGLLNGRTLREVKAHGKHLGYFFGRDRILHLHLGMYGDFRDGRMPMPEPKGALRLRMWTRRQWLELRGATDSSLYTEEQWRKLLDRLGPDPLEAGAVPASAFEVIERRKTPIGALLMDQSVIAGIGNVYRAELLYRARIHPKRPGLAVGLPQLKKLWRDAETLMRAGMTDRRIVTTRPADRPHKRGAAQDEEVHYVYGRRGKPCFVCGTKIESMEMAGRTAYWCPGCQNQ